MLEFLRFERKEAESVAVAVHSDVIPSRVSVHVAAAKSFRDISKQSLLIEQTWHAAPYPSANRAHGVTRSDALSQKRFRRGLKASHSSPGVVFSRRDFPAPDSVNTSCVPHAGVLGFLSASRASNGRSVLLGEAGASTVGNVPLEAIQKHHRHEPVTSVPMPQSIDHVVLEDALASVMDDAENANVSNAVSPWESIDFLRKSGAEVSVGQTAWSVPASPSPRSACPVTSTDWREEEACAAQTASDATDRDIIPLTSSRTCVGMARSREIVVAASPGPTGQLRRRRAPDFPIPSDAGQPNLRLAARGASILLQDMAEPQRAGESAWRISTWMDARRASHTRNRTSIPVEVSPWRRNQRSEAATHDAGALKRRRHALQLLQRPGHKRPAWRLPWPPAALASRAPAPSRPAASCSGKRESRVRCLVGLPVQKRMLLANQLEQRISE